MQLVALNSMAASHSKLYGSQICQTLVQFWASFPPPSPLNTLIPFNRASRVPHVRSEYHIIEINPLPVHSHPLTRPTLADELLAAFLVAESNWGLASRVTCPCVIIMQHQPHDIVKQQPTTRVYPPINSHTASPGYTHCITWLQPALC